METLRGEARMILSKEQQNLFWRTFKTACEVHNVPRGEQDAFRRGLIFNATGLTSLRMVNSRNQYDAVMLAVARLAGDVKLVDHFYNGDLRRKARRAEQNVRLALVCDTWHAMRYMEGILKRRHGRDIQLDECRAWWEDISPEDVDFLLKATLIALKRSGNKKPATPLGGA